MNDWFLRILLSGMYIQGQNYGNYACIFLHYLPKYLRVLYCDRKQENVMMYLGYWLLTFNQTITIHLKQQSNLD